MAFIECYMYHNLKGSSMAAKMTDDALLRSLCHDGKIDKIREYVDSVDKETLEERLSYKKGVFGYSVLHVAVSSGHEDVLKFLLEQGGIVNCRTNSGDTPLHVAASAGHLKCVEVLLKHDADISLQDNSGKTPKQTAELSSKRASKRASNSAIVKLLRSEGLCNTIHSGFVVLS